MAESQPTIDATQSVNMDTPAPPAVAIATDVAQQKTPNTAMATQGVAKGEPGQTAPDKQFQMFMGPMFAELEKTVKEHERVLDNINDRMKKETEERRSAQMQSHIPAPLKGRGQKLTDVMQTVEELIQYEIDEEKLAEKDKAYEEEVKKKVDDLTNWSFAPPEEEEPEEEAKEQEDTRKPVVLKKLDETSHAAITAHSLAAFVSTLNEDHLRKFTTKITADCQLWLSKMFRFQDSSVLYHEEPRDGLVRICRLALYNKYPKYATEGFEALYSRPPVIYLSSAAPPGLSTYICLQLGLPMSCICSVPCHSLFESSSKMDVAILEKLIEDDQAAAKTPVLLVAYTGTPVVGHVDHIEPIQELCKKNSIWLHIEGNNLATLGLLSVPSDILKAKTGDSMTVTMGQWLGIPGIPYATLFKPSDPSLVHAAGLNTFNPNLKLNCLPLWVSLQSLGIEGVEERITHSCELARLVFEKIGPIKTIKLISKVTKKEDNKSVRSIRDLITKAITSLLVFEMVTPTVVFRYEEDPAESTSMPVATYAVNASMADEEMSENTKNQIDYYNALNAWLADNLQELNPRMEIQAVEIEREGVCIRFAPLESAQVLGTQEEDIDKFIESLKQQMAILDATVENHTKFTMIVGEHKNLRVVDVSHWAGLGAVQYIPEEYLTKLGDLSATGKQEINTVNEDLVESLKSTDLAFSLGYTESDMVCVKFGLITEETDVEELVGMVQTQGKKEEESSRYMESMKDLVKKGIEEANKDLEEESQHKLMQEGLMRQVPIVGSLFNWWSPPPKDVMKGRRFNLVSGVIASTEDTYKHHMQVQEENDVPRSRKSSVTKQAPKDGKTQAVPKMPLQLARLPNGAPASPQLNTGTSPSLIPAGPSQDNAQKGPQLKNAGDVKSQLETSVQGTDSERPELAVAEGQEPTEEQTSDLRETLQNQEAQVVRSS